MSGPVAEELERLSVETLKQAPERILEVPQRQMFGFSAATQNDIQLTGLRKRFADLVATVPMLERLAKEQGVTEINDLNSAAPLLFPHTMYKSYPLSFLERNQFDRLTRWLNGISARDLSSVDTQGCDSIDEWIDRLDEQTDLRVVHSGGTTGKLSFIPRSAGETKIWATLAWPRSFDGFGEQPDGLKAPLSEYVAINPAYAKGAYSAQRLNKAFIDHVFGGDESRLFSVYPTRMSADIMSLGGRMQAAEAKGELGRLQVSPTLLKRREEFIREQEMAPESRRKFFDYLATELRGRRIMMPSTWALLIDIAEEGERKGLTKLFAPDSMVMLGGGKKGRVLPEGYRQTVIRFLGADQYREGFSMTEMMAFNNACTQGHFHLMLSIIPFLLDPKTGQAYPRSGEQTGRFGFIDLTAHSYWGGFVTGDEVTLNWGDVEPCPCGRVGPYVHDSIRRYSEAEGGDDKIMCAGAPEAHDKALEYLNRIVD